MQKAHLTIYESLVQIMKRKLLEVTHPNSLEMTD